MSPAIGTQSSCYNIFFFFYLFSCSFSWNLARTFSFVNITLVQRLVWGTEEEGKNMLMFAFLLKKSNPFYEITSTVYDGPTHVSLMYVSLGISHSWNWFLEPDWWFTDLFVNVLGCEMYYMKKQTKIDLELQWHYRQTTIESQLQW